MAAQASGARKLPAVNDSASSEIAHVTSASCARKRRTLRQSIWNRRRGSASVRLSNKRKSQKGVN
jgi:hypothetical protein